MAGLKATLLATALLASFACAPKRPGPVSWVDPDDIPSVTVQNDNFLDVAVYLVRGSSRFRIGTVRSTSSETFQLKHEGMGGASPVRILADPIGASRGYVTEPVVLGPGQRLEIRIASPITISSFAVYNR